MDGETKLRKTGVKLYQAKMEMPKMKKTILL